MSPLTFPKLINMSGNDPAKFTYLGTLPVYWRNDTTGEILNPIKRFIVGSHTANDLKIVIIYLRYVIFAPCWNFPLEGYAETLEAIRADSWSIEPTIEAINTFVERMISIGIDPL